MSGRKCLETLTQTLLKNFEKTNSLTTKIQTLLEYFYIVCFIVLFNINWEEDLVNIL